ncbi:hypothetical protein PVAND_014570 [Polypedilum vanderplanki]|uniref:Macro domain-containing protein n=1 Tax=Polypedilum vanderplanki TaxID=319348 RepID=A0A9J6BAE0_POLVA|nr:hypothetical protein PVAND_014570 [Polypedilum vanderplanki]
MGFVLKTINGDLFNATVSLAHCVGADFKMGMGIAVKFRDLFGQVDYLKNQKVQSGGCAVLKVNNPDRFIYYLVTKPATAPGILPTYESLESSLRAMREHMLANEVKKIAMPQIGCGLDKLQWNEVEQRLRNIFEKDDVEINVYVYSPPK